MALTAHSSRREYWEGRGLVLLWVAMLAAPAAWTIDQGLGYPAVKPSCAASTGLPLIVISLAAFAIALGGAVLGWWCLGRLRDADEEGSGVVDRSYFMAMVATGFNALVALLIVTAAIPIFVLGPCE